VVAGLNELLGWHSCIAIETGNGFLSYVFFMGLLPQNITDVIMFYILVVLYNEHTFMTLCNSVLFLCIFSFYINFIMLIMFFNCRIDFYCIKHIFSLQWYWSATFLHKDIQQIVGAHKKILFHQNVILGFVIKKLHCDQYKVNCLESDRQTCQ